MRLRSTPQECGNHGQFKKKCGCSLHNDFQADNVILRKTSSVAQLKSYKSLLENKLINSHDKYVGSSCLDLYKPVSTGNIPVDWDCESIEIDQQEPDCNINEEEIVDLVENLENKIKGLCWSKFSENLKIKISGLAETIGKAAYRDIYQDGVNIMKEYKDMQMLKMIKPQRWLKQRNPLLLSFLNGVTGVTVDNSSEKKINAFTHIVEQIYYTRNLNIITPFSFRQNLVMYSSTHSKTAV